MLPQGYEVPPLFRLELQAKMNFLHEFQLALDTNITDEFYAHIAERIYGDGNNIFVFKGPTGSGKSFGSMGIAEKKIAPISGVPFSEKDVYFSRTQLLENLREYRKKETVMLDEITRSFGIGSSREEAELFNILETVRKFQINFLLCSPRVHAQVHHGILEFWSIINKEIQQSIAIYSMEEFFPRGYVEIPKPSDKLLAGYSKKKDIFIDKMLKEQGGERFVNAQKTADELSSDEDFLKLKSQSLRCLYILKTRPQLRNHTKEEIKEIAQLAALNGMIKTVKKRR